MNKLFNKILVPVSYLAMLTVNYLATALPLGGRDTGAISDAYPNLFAPAGYAFSIWGLIYTLLGVYVVYQFSRSSDALVARINRLFVPNALMNAGWLFAWHYDIIWFSVILMLGLLVTLIKMADILSQSSLTSKERFLVRLPFSVYFGWITVAAIANITVFLVNIGWNGFGIADFVWTSIILLVGALIGILRTQKDKNIAYGLVLVWAYFWILFKHLSSSGYDGKYPIVIATVILCLVLFVFFIGRIIFKKKSTLCS